jgi:hypothetical protein
MKPIFLPLKGVHYDDFVRGDKTTEYRLYGPRWNERTCPVGRPVVLSRGYGKAHRAATSVKRTEVKNRHELDGDVQDALLGCYGAIPSEPIFCIHMTKVKS